MFPAVAEGIVDPSLFYQGMSAFLPELIISLGVVVLLLGEAFSEDGLGKRAAYGAIGTLLVAVVVALGLGSDKQTLFMGMIVIDPFTQFFRVLACFAGILGVLIALPSDEVGDRRAGEYYSMLLAMIVGMILMASASDLLMLYVAIELVSLMSFVLAGFRRKDRKGAEASLKYVIYGGAASGVMLFGFSLIYGLTGETQLALINLRVVELGQAVAVDAVAGGAGIVPVALTAGLVLSFAGFAYKIAAVPLHMWSPDVYEGAPTPFTAFLSTGPKAAGFAALLRFFVVGFSDASHFESATLLTDVTSLPWPQLIIGVSLVTMTLGNFAAIGQQNIKRFLAYSSIAHAGYSLIGLAAFSKTGASSVLMYMVFYLLMNIGAFYAVIWVREVTGSERIDDYRGLGYRAPLVAVALTVCLFSLTGLPPLAGFIGKFYLFSAALDRGASLPLIAACVPAADHALPTLTALGCAFRGGNAFYWLAVVAALNSAVSLYYYARVVRKMFLERPDDESPIHVNLLTKAILAPIAAAMLVFGIYWTPVWNASVRAVDFQRPTVAEVRMPGATPSMAAETSLTEANVTAAAE